MKIEEFINWITFLLIFVIAIYLVSKSNSDNNYRYQAVDLSKTKIKLFVPKGIYLENPYQVGDTVTFSVSYGFNGHILRKGYRKGIRIQERFAIITKIK